MDKRGIQNVSIRIASYNTLVSRTEQNGDIYKLSIIPGHDKSKIRDNLKSTHSRGYCWRKKILLDLSLQLTLSLVLIKALKVFKAKQVLPTIVAELKFMDRNHKCSGEFEKSERCFCTVFSLLKTILLVTKTEVLISLSVLQLRATC